LIPYFSTQDRIVLLRKSAESWLGTPFHPHGKTKGAGVSCQTLVSALYMETGFLPADYTAPICSLRWARGKKPEEAIDFVSKQLPPGLLVVDNDRQEIGDTLGFLLAGTIHFGVSLGQKMFIHCLNKQGVIYSRVDDATFIQRLARVWRPVQT